MKKWWLAIITAVFFLALIGCNNFSYRNPIGIPSLSLSLGDRKLTQDKETENWTLHFVMDAYTLPGSPAGVINTFHLANGGSLTAGLRVEECDPAPADECGPFSITYDIDFVDIPPVNSYVISAYTVVGQNGSVYTQKLAEPIVIR